MRKNPPKRAFTLIKHIDSWQVEPPCSASLRSSSSSLAKSEASGLSDSPVPSSALKSNIRLSSATNKKVSSPCFPPHGSLCWQLIKVSPNIEPSTWLVQLISIREGQHNSITIKLQPYLLQLLTGMHLGEHSRGPSDSCGEEGGDVPRRGGEEGQHQQGKHYSGKLHYGLF